MPTSLATLFRHCHSLPLAPKLLTLLASPHNDSTLQDGGRADRGHEGAGRWRAGEWGLVFPLVLSEPGAHNMLTPLPPARQQD